MKQKMLYFASVAVIISSSVFALMQVEGGSLIPDASKAKLSNELLYENESVSNIIDKLKSKYPHIKHPCLYASAMVIDDQAAKIPNLLEQESKCIHTLVISEGQEAHLLRQTAD